MRCSVSALSIDPGGLTNPLFHNTQDFPSKERQYIPHQTIECNIQDSKCLEGSDGNSDGLSF